MPQSAHHYSITTLLLASAIALAGCCTFTKPAASSRFLQLKNEHIAFIDAYTATAGGSQKEWDQGAFQSKVQTINQSFTAAASDIGIRNCPARKQFVKNSAELFDEDALFIEKHHSISAAFSQSKKEQIQKNYDSFLNK
jgi:hypothetical protein